MAPRTRQGDTYGKSSVQLLPEEEWVPLPDFPVISPIISWAQREAVLERLGLNKLQSSRNAKRFFELAGMLFCEYDGRRLSGHKSSTKTYLYRCPVRSGHDLGIPPCACANLPSSEAEERVWQEVVAYLMDPEKFQKEMDRQRRVPDGGEAEIRRQLETLERRLRKVDQMDTELVSMKLRDALTEEVYRRNLALNRAERTHLKEEIERQRAAMAAIKESEAAINSLVALRDELIAAETEGMESYPPERRRWVLQRLDTRITVDKDGIREISFGVSERASAVPVVSTIPRCAWGQWSGK